jgi:two-component system, cell cycle sensor histidine kinase and response regulator CckA
LSWELRLPTPHPDKAVHKIEAKMNSQLRILIVEDSEDDLLLLLRELRRGGYTPDYVRVETAADMQAALDRQLWDIVIADYTLPRFSAPEALQLLQVQQPDLPFIIVSGTIGEETAVAAMRAGAHDYLLKDNLTRLVPAVERELREAQERRKRIEAEQAFRESEERFRQLAENITESVFWMSDPTALEMLYVSPAYERIWGRSCANLYANFMDWIDAIHPEDRQHVHTNFFEHSLQGDYDEEYRIVRPDGSIRWIRDRGFPIQDRVGVPYRVVGIAEDITNRKLTEAALRRTERLESLGTLTSGIAHDLNNVLTPIMGIVQLLPLKITHIDASTQGLLQVLEDSTRRGADLVKQILSFTRGVESKPTLVQVSHLLVEIQKIIQQAFPKNIELSMAFRTGSATARPEDLWPITADATMLHQVFMNLCVNARDAMPDGGTLNIVAENLAIDENYARMHLDAQAGTYVVVTIADTGTGIAPEIIDRIFDPFFTTKEIGKGTGLGLSTVIGIIKSHHGWIDVDSQVGRGTRFRVYFPATDSRAAAPDLDPTPRLGQGELILIVDDEVAIQEVTKATLEVYGYQAITASDGIEAIALYAQHRQEIGVVLMDMMMPSLDSATLVRTLCKLNPQVQIIAMSGLATPDTVKKTLSEGVKAFLAKPFTASELLNLL